MINQKESRARKFGNQGFTLIEILIVVMVLGILAMVIVPQITVSTTDAKESTLETNLVAMRNAMELYYHQHDNTYPGYNMSADGARSTSDALSASSLILQLTQYTEASGKVATTKSTTAAYGPYLKSTTLPANPFVTSATAAVAVVCDFDEAAITAKVSDGTTGWKFYPVTGVLLANDGGTGHDLL